MTDAFLDEHATIQFENMLVALAGHVRDLEALASDAQLGSSAVGVRVSSSPARKSPYHLAAHDMLDLVRGQLVGWVRCLATDALVRIPDDTRTAGLARHLADHTHQIAHQEWARDMADEIADTERLARQIVDPPEPESITDRRHLSDAQVHHRAHEARGDVRDMAVIHLAVTGEDLPESTIRSWVRSGRICEHVAADGSPEYAYVEIAQLARQRRTYKTRRKSS